MATIPDAKPTNRFPKITEPGLEDLRQRVGVKIENTVEPWNYEATRDGSPSPISSSSIRRWDFHAASSEGIGGNPRCDYRRARPFAA